MYSINSKHGLKADFSTRQWTFAIYML